MTPDDAAPPRPAAAARQRVARWGIGARLMAVFALVIAVAGLTAGVVAVLVGPSVFHRHMVAAGLGDDPAALAHAEAAFRGASGTSLAIALVAAAGAALALSIAITRRVSSVVGELSRASRQIAGGRFDARVASPKLGAEFDGLADSFNQMGAALEESRVLRDRLAGDIAHELRTPVAAVTGYLEAIEDGIVHLTPEVMAMLRSQGERLVRLASDLAAAARALDPLLELATEETDPADLLEWAALAIRPAYREKGVDLVLDCEQLPGVRVDRDRFGQIMANLLENGLRHTPAGGIVHLQASLIPADGAPDVGRGQPKRLVRFTVADSGDGLAAHHLERVFERFYRADDARDRAHGGSGIGLAIAKALTEAHGGRIAAASPGPGQGATFTVDIPAAEEAGHGFV
ncbi:MAG: HAMP domain-containing protein [Bifidobacteriaceae bacterium]|jgi:signal transduction histidine kinase|nr:HAMP domain-containing protein [Bifidobacteriaceae bacterium]